MINGISYINIIINDNEMIILKIMCNNNDSNSNNINVLMIMCNVCINSNSSIMCIIIND